jgi:hypothetical protein
VSVPYRHGPLGVGGDEVAAVRGEGGRAIGDRHGGKVGDLGVADDADVPNHGGRDAEIAGHDTRAVGGECHPVDALPGVLRGQRDQLAWLRLADEPHRGRAIAVAYDEPGRVGAPVDRSRETWTAADCGPRTAGARIEDADKPVGARGGDRRAVRAPGDIHEDQAVPFQGEHLVARLDVDDHGLLAP